jgi:polyisoprenyl-phosphate glycosyltransferase
VGSQSNTAVGQSERTDLDRLWIVTPVYFDVASFRELRDRTYEVLANRPGLAAEGACFVVLDDSAGRDSSIEELRDLDDVRVITPSFNLGHQRGLVYALRSIAPEVDDDDVVVTMDSDGEDQPEDLPRIIDALPPQVGRQGEVALALRTGRRTSLAFKAMYVAFRVMFRLLTGTGVRTGNFAAMPGSVARRLVFHPLFDLSYSSTFLALDVPAHYVPCERGQRYEGRSKMGFSKLLLHGIQMLMPFIDRIAMRALVLFAVVLGLSAALGLGVIGFKLISGAAIPGWAAYTLLGAAILSLVALGNFVTLFTVYSQTRARSLAAVDSADHGRSRITPTAAD